MFFQKLLTSEAGLDGVGSSGQNLNDSNILLMGLVQSSTVVLEQQNLELDKSLMMNVFHLFLCLSHQSLAHLSSL